MPYQESRLATADGISLRTQRWTPGGAPRAAVVMTHGQGEHSGRYGHVGQAFALAGFAAYAYDLRGHGRSTGQRGHAPSYDAYLDDLQQVLDWAKRENSGRKFFLYGHSMGGQIVLNYCLRRKPEPAGVAVSAPWLRLAFEPPRMLMAISGLISALWPTFSSTNTLDLSTLSHDQAFLESLPDLALTHQTITARAARACFDAAAYALAHAAEFTWPLLLLQGEADRLVDPAGSQDFFDHVSSRDKTLQRYPGLYHEVHNETARGQVLTDVTAWLNQRA